jgi:phosphoglycolate phosphatase
VLTRLSGGGSIVSLIRSGGLTRDRFINIALRNVEQLRLYPRVRSTLQQLDARGTPMGIVTNLPAWLVAPILEDLNLDGFFATVKFGAAKPNPQPLCTAITELGLEPNGTVYYAGDQPRDAEAARNAGVRFAWASYGYGTSRPPHTAAILKIFSDVLEL